MTYEYHERDRFWTRSDGQDPVQTHCTGRRDDSPLHTTYPLGYDSRCSFCYLNIAHTERAHDQQMALYHLSTQQFEQLEAAR